MKQYEDDIRKGYNAYLKEITQTQKQNKKKAHDSQQDTQHNIVDNLETLENVENVENDIIQGISFDLSHNDMISTNSSFNTGKVKYTVRTTRRRTKQSPSSLTKLQVYTTPIELDFH